MDRKLDIETRVSIAGQVALYETVNFRFGQRGAARSAFEKWLKKWDAPEGSIEHIEARTLSRLNDAEFFYPGAQSETFNNFMAVIHSARLLQMARAFGWSGKASDKEMQNHYLKQSKEIMDRILAPIPSWASVWPSERQRKEEFVKAALESAEKEAA